MGLVSAAVPVQKGRLLCILGLGFGLAVTVGGTIAMGILRTPGEVAKQLPDAWLYMGVWVAGSIYALLGAVSVAEMGAMLPRSGGPYVFARRALGPYPGFIVGWGDWLNWSGSCALEALVIGEYSCDLIASLVGWEKARMAGWDKAIAVAIVAALALLQWRGVRWGSRTQEWTSVLKAIAFLALVICCFALGKWASGAGPVAEPVPRGWGLLAALVLAMQGVMFTYGGWEISSYFGEEVRDPGRNIPRSMIGGALAVSGIYLLLNLAVLYVLPISEIAGKDLAAGVAAQKVFGDRGALLFSGLALISLVAGLNAAILLTPRILFALSRDGMFFSRATTVNEGGTPTVVLLLTTAASVLFLLSGTFESVIAVLAVITVVNYGTLFVSVMVLRWREPEAERPYRAWGYPWTTALALLGSLVFLAGAVTSDYAEAQTKMLSNAAPDAETGSVFSYCAIPLRMSSIHALLLLAASCPVYLLVRWLNKPAAERAVF
jgi:APA family basic amino acid/polyamine antiporter